MSYLLYPIRHFGKRAVLIFAALACCALLAVSCLRLPLLSESLSCWDQSDGWMWLVEHFVAPGPPIGVVNTLRSSRLSSALRKFPLHHVPLVPCVRIIAGVGPIGSPGMPGGDHRNCVFP